MVVAVSTSLPQYKALYSQAKELGKYMLEKMDFEKVAELHSSSFPPEVLVREDGISTLPACSVYLHRGRRDILLFCGDASPMDEQYEFARLLLEYAEELGVKELYSIGARWADNPQSPDQDPEPNGFASDKGGAEMLKQHGVKLLSEEPAPFFASMVVGMAPKYGIRGYKLSVDHGEPAPHTRSVGKMLEVLSGLAGFKIPLEELRSRASTTEPKQLGDTTIYQ